MTSATVKLWYDKMLAAGFVTIADPRTEAGLNALVTAGLLTAERKSAIVEAMATAGSKATYTGAGMTIIGWRKQVALWFEPILDPFDPSGDPI